jgi:two-component system cell cycle response regulator CtrA
MRVLTIDDSAMAATLVLTLKAMGFKVETTDLGEEGVDLAKVYDFDAVTLDLNLPDISGLEVLRRLRAAKIMTPVLILTGDHSIKTKVEAFTAGADDYLTKPAHRDEIVCRLHALIRRSKGHAEGSIQAGPIRVLLDRKVVEVNGERVHLTTKEYGLLELLALRKGSTITKDMVLNHLYGGRDEPEAKIVDVYVCKLRGKLSRAGADGYVQTVWGRGYALEDHPIRIGEAPREEAAA